MIRAAIASVVSDMARRVGEALRVVEAVTPRDIPVALHDLFAPIREARAACRLGPGPDGQTGVWVVGLSEAKLTEIDAAMRALAIALHALMEV